ncbi:MAG: hypothetical protein ACI3XI_03115 [Eubacteriales bacterium]
MKLKSIAALFLVFVIMLGAVGCTVSGGTDTTGDQTTDTSVGSDETSSSDTSGSDETTAEVDSGLPEGQRLIFFEDFEDERVSDNSDEVLASLGWVKDSIAGGAYADNTTSYSIVSKDGSKQLYLVNNQSGGTDSYLTILSSALMGKYHAKNYTYQYDINYESSGDTKRYIALVSEYNGQFYNSFHLRNNGTANNQCHDGGSWLTYDVSGEYNAAATDENAISNKLLGVPYSSSATPLQGVSISIRYVVDWENGNSVYLRVNTAGYVNTGEWILVSKLDKSAGGASRFTPDVGGAGITLKTGARINGYVDNIIIWEGVGDEPEDKSAPLLNSKMTECSGHVFVGSGACNDPNKCMYCGILSENNRGHNYVAVDGISDLRCSDCMGFKSAIERGWLLPQVPAYVGGAQAYNVYLAGHGIADSSFRLEDDSKMQIVTKTNETHFAAYRDTLLSYGATEVYNYTCDGNIYYQYDFRGEAYVYTYYTASVKEVRIIYDNHSDCSPQDFGYTYEKKEGDSTVFYQYGVPMKDGSAEDGYKINHGHVYVMKLADNSVFIIDGGGYQQFDEAQADNFMKFLRDITGVPEGEKIKVAAWYISHGHQDHMAGVCIFVKKYHAEVDFDRIFFNLPSKNMPVGVFAGATSHGNLIGYIDKYLRDDDVQYIKIHTGQNFNLADVQVKVLYTHEDLVDPITGASEVANDYNNSCSIIKIIFDGKELLFLGDVNKPAMEILIANNSAETIKSDVIQLAHHVLNDLSKLYDITRASVVFSPQSYYGATLNSTRKKTLETALKYVEDDMIFYANVATYGVEFKDGKFQKVYESPTLFVKYTGWSW